MPRRSRIETRTLGIICVSGAFAGRAEVRQRGRVRCLRATAREGSLPPAHRTEGFGLEDFEEAGLRTVERRFGPRDMIFTPGDPDDQLYFLLSGTVRLYKIYGGYKEATVALLQDGGIFGTLDLEEGGSQSVFAEAVTDSRVASIQKASIE